MELTLVRKAQSGDQKALARLLQENYSIVFGYLLKVTLDRSTAEDIAQDTMIRAIEKVKSYNGKSKFSTWLIKIATNIYRDRLRRQKTEQKVLEKAERPYPASGETEFEVRHELGRALKELTPEKRMTLVLRYVYDYTYEEIAAASGVPVGTVRSRIHNGLQDLKKVLAVSTLFTLLLWRWLL